ncbi:hypothetical protein [Lacihabitans sp. CCS-44]|uniref:hypothetical protein n=1 Tax=Lacihabitans sp. CCS-44 TaxID=2487331 RepID=UPI0020CD9B51|nr:hypothetical protein [Lacihabitans sp. CCS-44]
MKNILKTLILLTLSSYSSFAAIVITNGLTHTHSFGTGQKVIGKIEIKNESVKPTKILIYKQDLESYCGQNITYSTSGNQPYSLHKYLTTNVDEKVLAANEQYVLYYTISAGSDSLNNGSYWTVLMIEGADPVKEEEANGVQINSVVRYAVQIIADAGKFQSPKLSYEDIKLNTREDSVKVLGFRLKNEGGFSTKTKVLVEIYDEKGQKIKTIDGLGKRVYPSQCNDFEVELLGFPKGKYEGIIITDNGIDLFGANISLELD